MVVPKPGVIWTVPANYLSVLAASLIAVLTAVTCAPLHGTAIVLRRPHLSDYMSG